MSDARAPSNGAAQLGGCTVYFWMIKVLGTIVGETASAYLSDSVGLGPTTTTFITSALLIAALVFPAPCSGPFVPAVDLTESCSPRVVWLSES